MNNNNNNYYCKRYKHYHYLPFVGARRKNSSLRVSMPFNVLAMPAGTNCALADRSAELAHERMANFVIAN